MAKNKERYKERNQEYQKKYRKTITRRDDRNRKLEWDPDEYIHKEDIIEL